MKPSPIPCESCIALIDELDIDIIPAPATLQLRFAGRIWSVCVPCRRAQFRQAPIVATLTRRDGWTAL